MIKVEQDVESIGSVDVHLDPVIVTSLSPMACTSSRNGATTATASGWDQKHTRVPKRAPTTHVVSVRGRVKRGSLKQWVAREGRVAAIATFSNYRLLF